MIAFSLGKKFTWLCPFCLESYRRILDVFNRKIHYHNFYFKNGETRIPDCAECHFALGSYLTDKHHSFGSIVLHYYNMTHIGPIWNSFDFYEKSSCFIVILVSSVLTYWDCTQVGEHCS